MFSKEMVMSAAGMYGEGKRPSQILREALLLVPDASVPDLMRLMQEAFSLPFSAVQCIGGWWHDGTGELSDAELDAFLDEEIIKVSRG
jgi:hypothetical protein